MIHKKVEETAAIAGIRQRLAFSKVWFSKKKVQTMKS
jgi:hypothetical protein